jgi:hypothetical protein
MYFNVNVLTLIRCTLHTNTPLLPCFYSKMDTQSNNLINHPISENSIRHLTNELFFPDKNFKHTDQLHVPDLKTVFSLNQQ